MRNTADLTGGKPIAVLLQSIYGVSAINPLVAFTIPVEERERCYSFVLSRTPRETTRIENRILDQIVQVLDKSQVKNIRNRQAWMVWSTNEIATLPPTHLLVPMTWNYTSLNPIWSLLEEFTKKIANVEKALLFYKEKKIQAFNSLFSKSVNFQLSLSLF
jgi:hypothetical protein